MAGELRDQRNRAFHTFDYQPVDAFEVAPEKLGERVERGFAARLRSITTRHERYQILLYISRARFSAARSA